MERNKKTMEKLFSHMKYMIQKTTFHFILFFSTVREGGRWGWMVRERVKERDKQEKGEKNKSKRHYRAETLFVFVF